MTAEPVAREFGLRRRSRTRWAVPTGRRAPVASTSQEQVRLVVLFGGQSAEHDVSRVTARNVLAALDPDRYDVHLIGIAPSGRWLQQGLRHSTAPRPRPLTVSGNHVDPIGHLRHTSTRRHDDDLNGDDLATVVLPLLHRPNGETAPCRVLRDETASPTSAAACWGQPCRWTRRWPGLCGHAGIPQARLGGAARA
nr:hypothetical protein [Candidatus Microthrix sp.]